MRFYSVLANLINRCNSCGLPLQLSSRTAPGFVPLINKTPFIKKENQVFNQITKSLSPQDLALLNMAPEDIESGGSRTKSSATAPATSHKAPITPGHAHAHAHSKECLRCRNIKYYNKSSPEPSIPSESIIEKTSNSRLVYVVNALEFPLGLAPEILRRKPIVVVNKIDLVHYSPRDLGRFPFFKQYFNHHYAIDPSDVILTSSTKGWGLDDLVSTLSRVHQDISFLGDTNAGKSTLISRLLYHSQEYKDSFSKFSVQNGPGISPWAGFTRDENHFPWRNNNLVDLPGLNTGSQFDLKQFKSAYKPVPMYKKGLYNHRYSTLKNDQILSMAGLCYIKLPQSQNVIVQYKSVSNLPTMVFKNEHSLTNFAPTPASQNNFLVPPPATNFTRYFIPPFIGTIELIIKDFGYVQLKPTGAKTSNNLFEVLVPNSISVPLMVRKPLVDFTYKVLSGRDKNGNVLNKQNHWKSTKVVPHYNNQVIAKPLLDHNQVLNLDPSVTNW